MPKVSLEFEVTDKGSAQVRQIAGQTEQAFDRLKLASVGAGQAASKTWNEFTAERMGPLMKSLGSHAAAMKQIGAEWQAYKASAGSAAAATATAGQQIAAVGQAADKAHLQFRTLRMGVQDLSMMLGQASPQLSMLGLGLGHLADRMSGLSSSAKLVGGSILAAGTMVAYFTGQFKESERVAELFAKIGRAATGLDVGALRGGILETSIELEKAWRVTEMSAGGLAGAFGALWQRTDDARRMLLGLPTAAEEAGRALDKLQRGLAAAMQVEAAMGEAKHAGEMAGIKLTSDQQMFQSLMARGVVGQNTVGIWTGKLQADVRAQGDAAKTLLKLQLQKALAEAMSRKTEDIEGPVLRADYAQKVAEVEARVQSQITQYAEQGRATRTAIAQQELADQTAIAREGMGRRLSILEQETQIRSALREADTAMAMAQVQGGELTMARVRQQIELSSVAAGLDVSRQASGQKIAEAEQLNARLVALIQGQLAQGIINERDAANQIRGLHNELAMAKIAALGQYGQALSAALAKETAEYTRHMDQIRALDKAQREARTGTADALAEIKQAGMSPEEASADRQRRAGEALSRAMTLEGQEQIQALQAVQNQYKALALEAAQSGKAQVDAAKQASQAWLSDLPGTAFQHALGQTSQAWQQFFGPAKPGAAGSAEWWAWDTRRGKMPEGWTPEADKAGKALGDAKSLGDKVAEIGKKIDEAFTRAKDSEQEAANKAKEIVDQTAAMLKNLQQSVTETDALAGAFERAAAAARALAEASGGAGGGPSTGSGQGGGGGGGRAGGWWESWRRTSGITPSGLSQIFPLSQMAGLYPVGPGNPPLRIDSIIDYLKSVGVPLSELSPGLQANILGEGAIVGGEGGGGYQHGGFVPGPIGAPMRGLVHGGEVVLNPAEQAVVRQLLAGGPPSAGSGRTGGDLVVQWAPDGRTLVDILRIPLEDAIRAGKVRITGK